MADSFGHGLVLGKFYPPHLGHLHLITEAAAGCDAVTVGWLRNACAELPGVTVGGVVCDAPVDYGDPVIWTAQMAVIRAALDRDGRPPVDAVFTGEGHGGELAGRLGAEHVPVDPGRRAVPVSASRLRAGLAGHWEYLIDPAQAALAARAGPALDELVWAASDFDAIAAEQTRRENEAAAAGSPLVVCDTDAFVTSVWERRYLGGRARGLQPWAAAALPPRDVYLLTSHEGVPWHDDGLREGDLAVRAAMTGWFMTTLTAAGHSWVLLTGSLDERLVLATRVTDYVLGIRSRFGASITEGAEIR